MFAWRLPPSVPLSLSLFLRALLKDFALRGLFGFEGVIKVEWLEREERGDRCACGGVVVVVVVLCVREGVWGGEGKVVLAYRTSSRFCIIQVLKIHKQFTCGGNEGMEGGNCHPGSTGCLPSYLLSPCLTCVGGRGWKRRGGVS